MSLPNDYLERIAARLGPGMREAFLKAVAGVQANANPDHIAALLEAGDVAGVIEALGLHNQKWLNSFRAALAEGFVAGGKETHAGLTDLIAEAIASDILPPAPESRLPVVFGVRNLPAEQALRDYDLSLIREVNANTVEGIRAALTLGMQAGRNPRQIALDLCGRIDASGERVGGIIGLTATQAEHVENARLELASTDPADLRHYLGRQLRDRRFDAAVLRAINAGTAIPAAAQEKAGAAYANAYLRYRAETVARTEVLRSASVGQEAALRNAVASGALQTENIRSFWVDTDDERTRPAHRQVPGMNPDGVPLGEAFDTPLGPMLYPRDPAGAAENVIGCRCWRQIRITGGGNKWLDMLDAPLGTV